MSKEAMTLALEALRSDDWFIHVNAIKALEEALAKQEQGEPKKKWKGQIDNDEFFESLEQEQGEPDLIECGNCHEGLADMEHVCKKCLGAGWVNNPKQEQGEPVGYTDEHGNAYQYGYTGPKFAPNIQLYTTPQPAQKPLTQEQIDSIPLKNLNKYNTTVAKKYLVRTVEAMHNIKE